MIFGPSKKKRKWIIIVASRFGLDALLQMACCVWEIYTHATLNELTPAQQNVVAAFDALYVQIDPDDDPDKFDACAYTLGEFDTGDVEAAIASL
jgi:hypothetical protein